MEFDVLYNLFYFFKVREYLLVYCDVFNNCYLNAIS